MQVSTRWPAERATDLRTTVTFADETLPVLLRIHFVELTDNETGERELRLIGVELGGTPKDRESAATLPELTALALRGIAERFPRWLELARAHALTALEERERIPELKTEATRRHKPARTSPEFLRSVSAEYRRHVADGDPSPVTTLGRSYGVGAPTASKWLRKARELGILKEEP